jgi:hypothetical protein
MGKLKVTLTHTQYQKGFEYVRGFLLKHTGWKCSEYSFENPVPSKVEYELEGTEMKVSDLMDERNKLLALEWGLVWGKGSETDFLDVMQADEVAVTLLLTD